MKSKYVYCDFANMLTFARFDGETYFCFNCGSTTHEEVVVREVNEHDI